MAQHKHAELIKAWADGAVIQYRSPDDKNNWWMDFMRGSAPSWVEDMEYRVKPPAPEYPRSAISDMALSEAWGAANRGPSPFDGRIAKACADAAVRHEYETQAAVPMADVQEVARNLAKESSAAKTLERLGYTDEDGELWKPPLGPRSGAVIPAKMTPKGMVCFYRTPMGDAAGPAEAINWIDANVKSKEVRDRRELAIAQNTAEFFYRNYPHITGPGCIKPNLVGIIDNITL